MQLVYQIPLLQPWQSTNFDRPDGITRYKYGYYYIGGYYLPGLYMTDSEFSYHPVKFYNGNNMVYPTYDPDDHSLLITFYEDDSWGRIPLTTTADIINIPNKKSLDYKIFPNPFNDGLNIEFESTGRTHVKLDVYNTAGKLVTTLINEKIESGNHSMLWTGKDDNSKQVADGLYYIKLAMDENIQYSKGIFIKIILYQHVPCSQEWIYDIERICFQVRIFQ